MPDEIDIIDRAMSQDDTDYGDGPVTQDNTQPGQDGGADDQGQVDGLEQQPVAQPGPQIDPANEVRLPTQQDAGRVPNVGKPGDNPNNFKRVGAQFADAKGNIVDKDGKILATAGQSARLWQEASRATAQVRNLTQTNEKLLRERESTRQIIQQAREIAEMPAKMGISREDYNEGIALMAKWRANPVEVAREIVARTLTFGHNVSDILGKTAGDALEMKAVTQLVSQATAPAKQRQELEARTRQQQETATKEYQQFVEKYDYAETHGEAIANLMTSRGVAANEAYYLVKTFALENGLDFTNPLGPQIEARRRQPAQRSATPAPMTSGGRADNPRHVSKPEAASADEGWGEIIGSVMRQT